MPSIASARKGLCGQAHAALMVEWRTKRHVHENLNATTAEGCDVGNSNPFCENSIFLHHSNPLASLPLLSVAGAGLRSH